MAASSGGVSGKTLADLFGIDERTVRKLATEGIIVRGAGKGDYTLGLSIKNYIAHLREQAAGRLGQDDKIDPVRANALLKDEIRKNYALKNAVLEGAAVPVSAIEPAWSMIVRAVRSGMLAAPGKIRMRLPHLTNHDGEVIEEVIRQQLEDAALADDPPQHKE